jgi:hypothetical protein
MNPFLFLGTPSALGVQSKKETGDHPIYLSSVLFRFTIKFSTKVFNQLAAK